MNINVKNFLSLAKLDRVFHQTHQLRPSRCLIITDRPSLHLFPPHHAHFSELLQLLQKGSPQFHAINEPFAESYQTVKPFLNRSTTTSAPGRDHESSGIDGNNPINSSPYKVCSIAEGGPAVH